MLISTFFVKEVAVALSSRNRSIHGSLARSTRREGLRDHPTSKQRSTKMQHQPVVSREEWLVARKALLAKEKEATHLRDKVNAERLALPWVKVQKNYAFD